MYIINFKDFVIAILLINVTPKCVDKPIYQIHQL